MARTDIVRRTQTVQRIPALPKTMRLRDVLGEGRAIFELGALPASLPALMALSPRGDGQPVLTLPGLMASDTSMAILRRFLRELGYSVHPWNLGRNMGPNAELRAGMMKRLEEIESTVGRRVSIVGWSLGGIYARELARRAPRLVRQVITLASPFAAGMRMDSRYVDEALAERLRTPPPVPCTAIYTKSDGVVAWQTCREDTHPHTENIEVPATHIGIGVNPLALYAIADRLAQPEGRWRPFEKSGVKALLYRERI